jgi:hypothetical protein
MAESNGSTLTAQNLKNALWETLQAIKNDSMQASNGDAIASQAREILRTVKVQLQVASQTKRAVPVEVIAFSELQEK